MHGFANSLFDRLRESVKQNEPLNSKCTFKIGGKCRFFVKVNSIEELVYALKECKAQKLRWFLLGGGSNVLFPDFFDGVVIDVKPLNKIQISGINVFASAGVKLALLCNLCKLNNLSGLEWAVSIPGTVGGAVKMNAGAFGYEFLNIVSAVYILDKGNIVCKKINKAHYAYRQNKFLKNNQIVLGVDLKLKKGGKNQIASKTNAFFQTRLKTQNVGYPSAGSVFKKTKTDAASFLIDKAGLKGLRVGGAMVSTVHAGYIVNVDNATKNDVIALCKIVKKVVSKKFKQKLEYEICIV